MIDVTGEFIDLAIGIVSSVSLLDFDTVLVASRLNWSHHFLLYATRVKKNKKIAVCAALWQGKLIVPENI